MGSRFYSERNAGARIRSTRKRATRPQTFKTEDSAKKYAEKMGIKSYDIVNLKNEESKTKKLKVVAK